MKAYCSRKRIAEEKDAGSRVKSILEPSSGGKGTRLNNARAKFVITIIEVTTKNPAGMLRPKEELNEKRIMRPKSTARKMFESMPAEATATVPHF